jgi:hypothetical protein
MGFDVQGGVRRGAWSFRVEGLADLPASKDLSDGASIVASRVAGLGLACVHAGVLVGCALAGAGVLRAEGRGLADAKQVSSPYVPVGARASVEVPVTSAFCVRAGADLLVPLTRTTFKASSAASYDAVWVSPAVSAMLGVGAGVSLR